MKSAVHTFPISENNLPLDRQTNFFWKTSDRNISEVYELIHFTSVHISTSTFQRKVVFEPEDIFFADRNLTKRLQLTDNYSENYSSIQLQPERLTKYVLKATEYYSIKQLLDISKYGLKITGQSKNELKLLINSLTTAKGIEKVILQLQCLQILCTIKEHSTILLIPEHDAFYTKSDRMYKILQFTEKCFQSTVTLQQAASIAHMSVSSFCPYFKRFTNKTFIDYLNEVRISYACIQLKETNKSVSEIGYESGYNTTTHFHRQFLKLKCVTPLQYRKRITSSKSL